MQRVPIYTTNKIIIRETNIWLKVQLAFDSSINNNINTYKCMN